MNGQKMPEYLNASYEGDDLFTGDQLRAAVAAEREACAKVCEEEGKLWSRAGCTDTQTFSLCATVIRART